MKCFTLQHRHLKNTETKYRETSIEISPMQYTVANPDRSSFLNMAPKVKKEGSSI